MYFVLRDKRSTKFENAFIFENWFRSTTPKKEELGSPYQVTIQKFKEQRFRVDKHNIDSLYFYVLPLWKIIWKMPKFWKLVLEYDTLCKEQGTLWSHSIQIDVQNGSVSRLPYRWNGAERWSIPNCRRFYISSILLLILCCNIFARNDFAGGWILVLWFKFLYSSLW